MYVVTVRMKNITWLNFVLNVEQSMKQVVDVKDLFWLVERYNKYYEEHNENAILIPRAYIMLFKHL